MNKILFCLSLTLLSSCLHFKSKAKKIELKNIGSETDISILTFNILAKVDLAARDEGYLPWASRKKKVLNYIKKMSPSLVAVQENTQGQLADTANFFDKQYNIISFLNVTSDAAILVMAERFRILESGYWDLDKSYSGIKRIAAWVKLEDKETAKQFAFISTHLDAKDQKMNEIKLLTNKINSEFKNGVPVFLAGDFNFESSTDEYLSVIKSGLKDSFSLHFNVDYKGFTYPSKSPSRRIDHIFYQGKDILVKKWIIIPEINKSILSDHLPVYAEFNIHGT